eukprot:scaffold8119_cov444-Prasinococcus_capsulatus_cf.AAC.8
MNCAICGPEQRASQRLMQGITQQDTVLRVVVGYLHGCEPLFPPDCDSECLLCVVPVHYGVHDEVEADGEPLDDQFVLQAHPSEHQRC